MITVDKNTIMVKVSVFAEGYYSGSSAYGEIFLPKDIYGLDGIKEMNYTFYELDGKHSETDGEITLTEGTIEELLLMEQTEDNHYYDNLLEEVIGYIDLDYDDLEKLNSAIRKLSTKEEKIVTLTEDTILEGVNIPKGAIVKYTYVDIASLDDFSIDIEVVEDE